MGYSTASVAGLAARLLYRLVSVPSPSGSEDEAVRVFVEEAARLGLDAWTDRVGNAYAAPSGAERRVVLLLAGHIDTVEGWIEPQWRNGVITGRGAVDAKGPLASMLAAVAVIAQKEPSKPIGVVGLVGEEADSRGAVFLARHGPPPFIVIGEPTGTTRVAIGYRGSMRLRVLCRGRGGHTSSPWAGDSALDKLLDLLAGLRKNYQEPTISKPTITPVRVLAGNGDNTLPRRAEAVLDVRIPPGTSPETVLEEIRALLHRDCITEPLGDPTPPVKVKPTSPVPRAIIRALLSQGYRPAPVVKAGTSDMNILAQYTRSIAAYGPGDPSLSHTDEERVGVEELGVAAKTYMLAAEEILKKHTSITPARLPE